MYRKFALLPVCQTTLKFSSFIQNCFSTSSIGNVKESYKLVVIGGGSGGCSVAARFCKKLGSNNVAIIEPSEIHYYQPLWTLVGGGIKSFEESGRQMQDVLPIGSKWIKDSVVEFDPQNNEVVTKMGTTVSYDYLVVAAGLQLNFQSVKGLEEALKTPEVCSNYSAKYVKKTFPAIKNFKQGNAIFTFPNTPIKCAGAPQKIMYLAEDYFRKHAKRENASVMYFTSLPVIFGVKKYADELMKIVKRRDIKLNFRSNLIEVNCDKKEAIFDDLDKPGHHRKVEYSLLHVTPPMSPIDVLKNSPLSDSVGWVNVNKDTLQHVKYPNVFGIGDCTNLPTSRTAAAVAGQVGVLYQNLVNFIEGRLPNDLYDGYTSCPLVTGYGHCVLAEFDYNNKPLETLPINQAREMRLFYHIKKDVLPEIYWRLMLSGNWKGPGLIRKITHLGMSR